MVWFRWPKKKQQTNSISKELRMRSVDVHLFLSSLGWQQIESGPWRLEEPFLMFQLQWIGTRISTFVHHPINSTCSFIFDCWMISASLTTKISWPASSRTPAFHGCHPRHIPKQWQGPLSLWFSLDPEPGGSHRIQGSWPTAKFSKLIGHFLAQMAGPFISTRPYSPYAN